MAAAGRVDPEDQQSVERVGMQVGDLEGGLCTRRGVLRPHREVLRSALLLESVRGVVEQHSAEGREGELIHALLERMQLVLSWKA